MRKILLPAMLLCLGLTPAAHAFLIFNGDFDDGLSGWTVSGDVQARDADVTYTAYTACTTFAAMGMQDKFALLGARTTSGPSTLSQSFSVSDVDSFRLSFAWVFDYADVNLTTDDVFFTVYQETGGSQEELLRIDTSDLLGMGIGTNHGTFTRMIDVSNSGATSKIIFVINESACLTNSSLGIDNVTADATPVPLPAAGLLLGAGLVGLGCMRREPARPKPPVLRQA